MTPGRQTLCGLSSDHSALSMAEVSFANPTAQKETFSLRISSENVTKSAGACGFGHIY